MYVYIYMYIIFSGDRMGNTYTYIMDMYGMRVKQCWKYTWGFLQEGRMLLFSASCVGYVMITYD